MQFELENIKMGVSYAQVKKFIDFTIEGYHFYTIIYRSNPKNFWKMVVVNHDFDAEKRGKCPMCQKDPEKLTITHCPYFEDKYDEFLVHLLNHPALRLQFLLK